MSDFMITFWGVRGSYPAPGSRTVKFGGNTPCVQIEIGEHLMILDAGTGICNLGQKLLTEYGEKSITGDLFITHAHWDHIQGLPFFSPAFNAKNNFRIYGTNSGGMHFSEILRGQMKSPYFPVEMMEMEANLQLLEFIPGAIIDLENGITVKTFPNNHPNGGASFRIEHNGRSCCYITDIEHDPKLEATLTKFVEGTDLLIYDANYTLREYLGLEGLPKRIGWGHSTWEEGIKLLNAAKAKQLAFFHHDPNRADNELEAMEIEAQSTIPNCFVAREGMIIHL